MPIYEYRCSDCGKEFELLVQGSQTPACPECMSPELQKKLSSFAVNTKGGGSLPPSPCGGCPDSGACGMN